MGVRRSASPAVWPHCSCPLGRPQRNWFFKTEGKFTGCNWTTAHSCVRNCAEKGEEAATCCTACSNTHTAQQLLWMRHLQDEANHRHLLWSIWPCFVTLGFALPALTWVRDDWGGWQGLFQTPSPCDRACLNRAGPSCETQPPWVSCKSKCLLRQSCLVPGPHCSLKECATH